MESGKWNITSLRHSTGKFPGENETSCPSSSNVFLVNGNDLCKLKTAVPELNLLVLKRFR